MKNFEWDEKRYRNDAEGIIIHGQSTNLKGASAEDVRELQEELTRCGVKFKIREATQPSEHIQPGDPCLVVKDPKSIYNLYANFFHYTMTSMEDNNFSSYGHLLISESIEDYDKRVEEEKKEEALAQKAEASFMKKEEAFKKDPKACISALSDNIANVLNKNPEIRQELFKLLAESEVKQGNKSILNLFRRGGTGL